MSPTEWHMEPYPGRPPVAERQLTSGEQLFLKVAETRLTTLLEDMDELAIAAHALPAWAFARLFRSVWAAWTMYRLIRKIIRRIEDVRELRRGAPGYMRLDDL